MFLTLKELIMDILYFRGWWLFIFISLSIFEDLTRAEVPQYLKTKYGSNFGQNSNGYNSGTGVKTSYTKTKTKTVGSYNNGGYGSPGNLLQANNPGTKYRGGCNSKPPTPMNAGMQCSQYSGCRVDCIPNYQFPNGDTQLKLHCDYGQWKIWGTNEVYVPSCQPICLPACQNNGICVAPNQCNCPENFSGPQCQFENRPCLNYPPMPMNAKRKCNSKTCTITCMEGHIFPDGSQITQMICKDGFWVPAMDKWSSIPDCQAICNPPCMNGGNCLSFNVCQCPQNYRGPQCQYSAELCSAKHLQFNGAYNCNGNAESFSCTLSCPEGIQFEFPPAPVYTCYYANGMFEPSNVPQCIFPSNVQVINGPETSNTFYHTNTSYDVGSLTGQTVGSSYNQGGYYSQTTGGYKNSYGNEVGFNDSNVEIIQIDQFGKKDTSFVTAEQKLPQPGICFAWGGTHYKTFDGKVFSFDSKCSHVLLRDSIDNTFSIVVQNSPSCYENGTNCHKILKIYLDDKKYILYQSESGIPIFASPTKNLPIPGRLPGLRVEMSAHYVIISLDTVGAKLKWNQKLVQVEVLESLWNRTEGLCGKIDGDIYNDAATKEGQIPKSVTTLASSWKADDFEDICNDTPTEEYACQDNSKGGKGHQANKFCKKLLADQRFSVCQNTLDIYSLLDACKWDYCNCNAKDPSKCACETLDVYVRDCTYRGVKNLANWRDEQTCPMECKGGMIYKSCGSSKGQAVCGAAVEIEDADENCVEGCYCPEGTVLHDNKCITKDKCPCQLRGKSFPAGSSVPKDCNTCTCNDGQWICTQVSCGARCSAIGDPHYTTFDGKKYDFMGQCSYYLVKNNNFSIEAENVACAGSISQAMNFPASVSSGLPSCTKTITIRINGQVIKLKQNHDLVVNGQDVTKVPYSIAGVTIRSVSSIFLLAELPNGVEVWWDGITRVYIDVPASFKGDTKGLCGTFNNNQKDDFLTPEEDIEISVIPFANKWKTNEACNDVPEVLSNHPCDVNLHKKQQAEKYCKYIKSNLFKDCHWQVDPEEHYQNCMYDMCACELKVSQCLCATVGAYASECAKAGIKIDWRNEVRECGIHCPGGQKYQVCGNSCTRTCSDIATRPYCQHQCVEGCNCPDGEALDENGECIPIGQCKCEHDGLEFPPGYKEIRPASKAPELCTCLNAQWRCTQASQQEMNDYPKTNDLKSKCRASDNFEFTPCEPVEPVTCKNMHSNEGFSPAVCHAGCKCKEGFVLDTKSKRCVRPEQCPCHHGGKSYKENETVQSDCNTCKCENGKWKCTDRQCTAECSTWGDSHFKTFDGKHFDYQGQCDYVLAKGSLGKHDSFTIILQTVPCGSLGTTCSKSVTIKVTSGNDQESITLTRDKSLPAFTKLKHLTLRHKGLFVIVEAPDLGLVVLWDKGTRVYVKVDPRWKDKLKGLCGNYNNNEADDFQTPSGGLTEASANIFGDSWRLQSYCPEAEEVTNTCEERPDRKVWALKKCGIMKSSLFAPCHSEVPLDNFFDRCIFDACACDQGGDCECLCTALAAYAQECNNRGVPIKWRSQDLCPMQCDERCSKYSPCISTCPTETCDNLLTSAKLTKKCGEDTCIEGCVPKPCPPGQVYLNTSYQECVPRNICTPICLELDKVVYYEGDIIEEDDCHSCHCSRGEKICTGLPCPTTLRPALTTHQLEQLVKCRSGWTPWINQDRPQSTKSKKVSKKTDFEPVPSGIILNNLKESATCGVENMVDIECRDVKTHLSGKESNTKNIEVECSLERGLICKASGKGVYCPDFEIRIKCDCDNVPTTPIPCDVSKPHLEHPKDCHLFYHCEPGLDGAHLVEKSCGKDMMYNPQSMTCDWPQAVMIIKPSCNIESIEEVDDTNKKPKCPVGMVYEECAIQCDRLCMFYSYAIKERGLCQDGAKCSAGCVSADKKLSCPDGMLWADEKTCVAIDDCICRSPDGKPVKPGLVINESNCTKCQCVENYYSCHKEKCEDETEDEDYLIKKTMLEIETESKKVIKIATLPPLILVNTLTPPEKCTEDRFIDLIQGDQPLSDEAFSASSVLSPSFAAHNARLNNRISETSGGSWAPEFSNENQYLQIDLGKQEPIYGVILRGSPLYEEYVTSFKVLYSPDGHTYYYVLNDKKLPHIFQGSIDTSTPVKVIFETPFEAQIVRINPQTWNNGISLRVELIGCGEPKPTPSTLPYDLITIRPTIKPKLCEDPMGLGEGLMSDQQIATSSQISPDHNKKHLKLNEDSYWQPLTNSVTEWVQFDFLEPRNITGFVTRGGNQGWVTAFNVKYSHNKKDWNPIMDDNQKEKVFLGNFNKDTPKINAFEMPINTRYVRLIPIKWHQNIQLRVEIHGCYKPYPYIEEILSTVAPSPCNTCPGVEAEELEMQACRCKPDMWWDGSNCVSRSQCPCMVGQIAYPIGSTFEEEDCQQCVCKLGGNSHCTPKKCDKCPEGLRSSVTSTCACTCKPCPPNEILCPTSNICINSTLWCNGIQDCPDDELNCPTTVEEIPTTTPIPTTKKPVKKCPIVECQPGYKRREIKTHTKSYLSPMILMAKSGSKSTFKGIKASGVKGVKKPNLQKPIVPIQSDEPICKEYKCVSNKPPPKFIHTKEECPPVVCQHNYVPVFDIQIGKKTKECPRYSCYPPPEPDAVCNVTGRTFNTFDETEFKYDICNHVLARDLQNEEWDVSLKKSCNKTCSRDLIIRHNTDLFTIHPDLSVDLNGYRYNVDQIKKIGSQSDTFSISQLGNTLLFASNKYGFWVVWNTFENVKLGVVSKLIEKVDGLCGYFNDAPEDDKRKPDGTPAKTTIEFGDSWALASDQPLICESKTCPINVQNKAWEMCNKMKDQTLSPCAKVVNIEAFVSRCLETTCACLENAVNDHNAEEKCRCQAMQTFVVDCLTADNTIDLSDWRMQHDCPATCEAPLVYHDCYQRKCEPTCESINDPNVCPKIPNVCFPGCYCPQGFVRKGDTCIPPSACRDCECNLLPHLQYVTYDENNFTINGNCVYVMSRDLLEEGKHKFQVLVTNAVCRNKKDKTCVGKITILYEGRKIHILLDEVRNKLKLIVDSERIDDFSELSSWARVRETATKHIKMLLTDIQVEVSVYYPSLGVSVKAPSHKYGGRMEGLCGDCNGDTEDDYKKPSSETPKDINDFANSWLYENLPGGQSKEQCENKPEEKCKEIPADGDPCAQLNDTNKFGQCLNVLNPSLFLDWCKKDICSGDTSLACASIEAFARDCASAGFCVNWRNEFCPAKNCPADQVYDPCGTSCPKTCAGLKEKDSKVCKEIPVEGCFCPEGKLLLNNTCVVEKDCEVCDDEGHHPGDKWKKDKCTSCTCEGTALKCETQRCSEADKICSQGFTLVELPSKDDECCAKYTCVPEPTAGPTCEPPQKLLCGPGQNLKLDTKPNGCQAFICECKPKSECEKILPTEKPLEDGYVREIDDSGCCPVEKLVCKKELCPQPSECPQFYNLKKTEVDGKCCPVYECEAPKKCIYETEFTAATKGGERHRTRYEKQKLLKNANETWSDGPCRECKCLQTDDGKFQASCSKSECPSINDHPDLAEFELREEPVFEKCCPNIVRDKCKYNGKVYKEGETWTKENDNCVTFECVKTSNGLQKETNIKSCDTTCDIGYEYVPAPKNSTECCGSCKCVGCVMDGKLYKVGEEWSSPDHCTNYYCQNNNGSMQVQSVLVVCAELPEDYIINYVYETITTPGECCKKYKQVACKVGNEIYQVGEFWPSPDGDKCKAVTCVAKESGELVKQESIETCKKDCAKGWLYQESKDSCCGECIQTACIVDDVLKLAGESWLSPDNCTTFTCENIGGQFIVSSQQESCPSIDDCPAENIYVKGCCKHCKIDTSSQVLCSPEALPLEKTIGIIKTQRYPNGNCINRQPISNFTECVGSCQSSTSFNLFSGTHESVCSCCQATKYDTINVDMTCDDGYKWVKKVSVPSRCDCNGCAANNFNKYANTKTGVKTSYGRG